MAIRQSPKKRSQPVSGWRTHICQSHCNPTARHSGVWMVDFASNRQEQKKSPVNNRDPYTTAVSRLFFAVVEIALTRMSNQQYCHRWYLQSIIGFAILAVILLEHKYTPRRNVHKKTHAALPTSPRAACATRQSLENYSVGQGYAHRGGGALDHTGILVARADLNAGDRRTASVRTLRLRHIRGVLSQYSQARDC